MTWKRGLLALMFAGVLAMTGMALALGPEWTPGNKEKPKDIIDTAIDADNFDTLISLLVSSGLNDTLRQKGPYTVFAPQDEAFLKLAPGSLRKLLMYDQREMLYDILTMHVVAGKHTVKDLQKLNSIETVNGQAIGFYSRKWALLVDNAKIIRGDIECQNGVLHVIDRVLLPRIKLPQ